ncbi:MAG: helix-turn-helix domain-containing protein [Actinomycetota bacterium]
MPTSAPHQVVAVSPHQVVALALPGVVLLDLAAPTHLFGHCGDGRYSFAVASAGAGSGPVPTSTGLEILASGGLDLLAGADTVVVPGRESFEPPAPAVLAALRAVRDRGARVMSVCTGAFVLAQAGLLDGLRATTHWTSATQLAEEFPLVTVDPAVLYVDEGQVLTSAGVAAGLDLCLHVIRRDHGADYAARIARRTVVAPHRDGGQAQFIRRPVAAARGGRAGRGVAAPGGALAPDGAADGSVGLAATRAWALDRLGEPLTVPVLARQAGVSPRTFARHFRAATGTTPARWVLDQRILAARQLLERTSLSVEQVAARSGFTTPAALREHFARRVATTPTAYRRAFRQSA